MNLDTRYCYRTYKNRTVLVVAHHLKNHSKADQILRISKGNLLEKEGIRNFLFKWFTTQNYGKLSTRGIIMIC